MRLACLAVLASAVAGVVVQKALIVPRLVVVNDSNSSSSSSSSSGLNTQQLQQLPGCPSLFLGGKDGEYSPRDLYGLVLSSQCSSSLPLVHALLDQQQQQQPNKKKTTASPLVKELILVCAEGQEQQLTHDRVKPEHVDLESLSSVEALSTRVLAHLKKRKLDFVIVHSSTSTTSTNGGKTPENGLSHGIATQHLAPALLAVVLQPRRWVHVVVAGAAASPSADTSLDVENWVEGGAVTTSNVLLAQALFAQALSKRMSAAGVRSSNLVVNGDVDTQTYLALGGSPITGAVLSARCAPYAHSSPSFFHAEWQSVVWHATQLAVDPKGTLQWTSSSRADEEEEEEEEERRRRRRYVAPDWSPFQAAYEFQSSYMEYHHEQQDAEEENAKGTAAVDEEEIRLVMDKECEAKLLHATTAPPHTDCNNSQASESDAIVDLKEKHAHELVLAGLDLSDAKDELDAVARSCRAMEDTYQKHELRHDAQLNQTTRELSFVTLGMLREALAVIRCKEAAKASSNTTDDDDALQRSKAQCLQTGAEQQMAQRAQHDEQLAKLREEHDAALLKAAATAAASATSKQQEEVEQLKRHLAREVQVLREAHHKELEALRQAALGEINVLEQRHAQDKQLAVQQARREAELELALFKQQGEAARALTEEAARVKLEQLQSELNRSGEL